MKTFALALGGGGARGLAHVPVLEALDELGARPSVIAGSSIGAAIGAAYAAGMSGKDIRRYVLALLHDQAEVFRRLFSSRVATGFSELMAMGFGNPVLLDAHKLAAAFFPPALPDSFEALGIPLLVMTTDFYARQEAAFEAGPLRPALAASLAVPGVIRPVEIAGRILIDGAAVNPLPFDRVRGRADSVVAVDTSVGRVEPRGVPEPWEALLAAIQILGHSIVREKIERGRPDVLVRPRVGTFRLLDFLAASAILRTGDAVKDDVKRQLGEVLGI